ELVDVPPQFIAEQRIANRPFDVHHLKLNRSRRWPQLGNLSGSCRREVSRRVKHSATGNCPSPDDEGKEEAAPAQGERRSGEIGRQSSGFRAVRGATTDSPPGQGAGSVGEAGKCVNVRRETKKIEDSDRSLRGFAARRSRVDFGA